jgi:hypothetical protein
MSLNKSDCSVYKNPKLCNTFKENCEWDEKLPKKGHLTGINIFKYSKGKCINKKSSPKKKASSNKNSRPTKKASSKKKASPTKKASSTNTTKSSLKQTVLIKESLQALKQTLVAREELKIEKAHIINKMLIKNDIHEEFEDILELINKYPKKSDKDIVKLVLKYTNNRKSRDSGPYTKRPDFSGSWNSNVPPDHWKAAASEYDEGGGGELTEEEALKNYAKSKAKNSQWIFNTKLDSPKGKWRQRKDSNPKN